MTQWLLTLGLPLLLKLGLGYSGVVLGWLLTKEALGFGMLHKLVVSKTGSEALGSVVDDVSNLAASVTQVVIAAAKSDLESGKTDVKSVAGDIAASTLKLLGTDGKAAAMDILHLSEKAFETWLTNVSIGHALDHLLATGTNKVQLHASSTLTTEPNKPASLLPGAPAPVTQVLTVPADKIAAFNALPPAERVAFLVAHGELKAG